MELEEELSKNPLFESGLSRFWGHLTGDGTLATISAFTEERTEAKNLIRHREMGVTIRSLGFGRIQLAGGYRYQDQEDTAAKPTGLANEIVAKLLDGADVENSLQPTPPKGGVVSERSWAIPDISLKQALDLGRQFEQESVMFKDEKHTLAVIRCDTGKILNSFENFPSGKEHASQRNMTFDPKITSAAFSSLFKGTAAWKGLEQHGKKATHKEKDAATGKLDPDDPRRQKFSYSSKEPVTMHEVLHPGLYMSMAGRKPRWIRIL